MISSFQLLIRKTRETKTDLHSRQSPGGSLVDANLLGNGTVGSELTARRVGVRNEAKTGGIKRTSACSSLHLSNPTPSSSLQAEKLELQPSIYLQVKTV